LVCVGIALFLAQRLTYRLLDLERRTRLIAIGDFSPMPLPTWNDEIRDLTRSVNNMAQQLQGMQETIKQTERLQLLGQVAGGLAHQLRNAATGARLAVQVYVGELQHPSDREPLEIALRQLGLIEERLQRFLQLGRAEEPERSLVELRTLMGEVAALLRPNCQHLKVHLRMPEHPASANVLADAEQLRQVLINVLTNAIEAVGSGGLVEIHWSVNESTVTLEISDNGPGPDPKIASRLFEPFVTGKTEGIGLGLAVVKHTVERHGGTVTWERLGDRTCFRIRLPRYNQNAR
jgi:signal transduction histidine kinase